MKLNFITVALLLLTTTANAGEILRLKATGPVTAESLLAVQMASAHTGSDGLFLVQWKANITESEKAQLQSMGLSLLAYVPDDAFLVRGDAMRAAGLSFVNAVVPFGAGLKVEPELTQAGVFGFSQNAAVSIQLAPGGDLKGVMSQLTNAFHAGNGLVTGASSVGGLWKLAERSDVLWIERYLPFRSASLTGEDMGVKAEMNGLASETGYESGTKLLNVDAMYSKGISGQGQIVAVADTGLDSGDTTSLIPDFQGQLKKGIAIGLGGKSWGDPMMHGTHVSGSILGNGHSSNGLIRGGAFSAQLVMEGMWSDIMNNIMPPAIPKLFDAAYAEGARIHSNSWGAPGSNGRYDNWAVLTDTWLFQHMDFLAVFAAGNDGADLSKDGVIDLGTVSSPGTSKNVLTVGASKNFLMEGGIQKPMKELRDGATKWGVEPLASSRLSEDQRGMAAFSSRGPTMDGRLKPEIVAPGTNIVSARDRHPKADPATMSWGVYDDNYVYMGGTSMATPVTAGAMALTRQFLVQKTGNQNVSSALMKATVANTAEDLFPGQFGERATGQEQPTRRPNNHEGWGRVNLANMADSPSLTLEDEAVGLSTGQEKVFSFSNSGRVLRVTLAYTDAPGTAAAQKTLVNDLDLTVIDPSGRTLYPNGLSGKDSTNNMEQIDVLQASTGTYQIKVRGGNVPQGKNGAQPYALAISSAP